MTVETLLRGGHVLLTDEADSKIVSAHHWHAWFAGRRTFYAATNVRQDDGSRTTVLLHNLLVPLADGREVDHRNGNGLDDRRANLRAATPSQNRANRPAPANSRSGFKGVSWNAARGKWTAGITVDRRRRHLGYFLDAREAALAYDLAALEAWGEFAYLNRPEAARDGGTGCPGNAHAT